MLLLSNSMKVDMIIGIDVRIRNFYREKSFYINTMWILWFKPHLKKALADSKTCNKVNYTQIEGYQTFHQDLRCTTVL